MEESKKDIYKVILLGVSIILLIIFVVISKNVKSSNESNIIQNDIYSNKNSIDENNLKRISGYNNLYYYEIDLETY